jgi:hypothetical protein
MKHSHDTESKERRDRASSVSVERLMAWSSETYRKVRGKGQKEGCVVCTGMVIAVLSFALIIIIYLRKS